MNILHCFESFLIKKKKIHTTFRKLLQHPKKGEKYTFTKHCKTIIYLIPLKAVIFSFASYMKLNTSFLTNKLFGHTANPLIICLKSGSSCNFLETGFFTIIPILLFTVSPFFIKIIFVIKNGYSFPKNTYNLRNALHVITYIPKKETTQRTFSKFTKPKKLQPWLFKKFDIRKVGKVKHLFENFALIVPSLAKH